MAAAIVVCVLASLPRGQADEPPIKSSVAIEHVPRQIEGWTVQIDKRLLEGEHAALGTLGLRILEIKLTEIALLVPPDPLAHLREVPIFVDLDHPLKSLQYHPSVDWLRDHGHDPAMKQSVHVPQIQRLIDLVQSNTQPAVLIHELAHAYHDRVLGFDHGAIRQQYEQAVAGGQYESVLHIGGRRQRHYALTNHKEFFAEMTEAFLSTNDFYPFVRAELAECDARTFGLLESIWRPAQQKSADR